MTPEERYKLEWAQARDRVCEGRCKCCGVKLTPNNWLQRGVYNCHHR